MASQADICNLGLINLGQSPDITSINPPDGTKYAATAAAFWPIMLDKVLGEFDWDFARKLVTLQEVSDAEPEAWQYAFALPIDMVEPRMLQQTYQQDPNVGIPYEIKAGILYCNEADVVLRYTFRNTNYGSYSNGVVLAMGAYMAHLLAAPVMKDVNVSAAWAKQYQNYLGQALLTNSFRTVNPYGYESPGISARRPLSWP